MITAGNLMIMTVTPIVVMFGMLMVYVQLGNQMTVRRLLSTLG